MNSKIFVVIPAYNEAQVIGDLISELIEIGYQIIVVDDNSSDKTSMIALNFPIFVLRHPINLGQGAALQTGISFALNQQDCDYIVTFDADGQHRVEAVARLVSQLIDSGSDIVLGSRFLLGANAVGIPKIRVYFLKLATMFTRLTTGLKISDAHNGLKAFTRLAASQINITQNRMAHASEILQQLNEKNLSYIEVPVDIIYSQYSLQKGQSIMNSINILWDLFFGRK